MDLVLTHAAFEYNDLMKKSTCKTPFQIIYDGSPNGIVDLIMLLDLEEKISVDVASFAKSIHEICEQVKNKL